MPFTLAHPAAILPLRRAAPRFTSLPALVIGSMAPDFVYFFPLGVGGGFSHSLPGTMLFCVPASVVVYLMYYLLLREPLVSLLPDAIASRLAPRPDWVPGGILPVLILLGSFLAGAMTHVLWDGFTHGHTLFARTLGVLRIPIHIGTLQLPLYNVLQHLSSVLGLAVLAMCTLSWMRRTPPRFVWRHRLSATWRAAACGGLAIAGAGGGVVALVSRPASTLGHAVFNGVVGGMAWTMLALLFFAAWWRLRACLRTARN